MLEEFHRLPIFRDLEIQQLCALEALFERYACVEDALIFEQGQPADFLYVLLSGTVVIQFKPEDGPPISITRLKSGDIFGWSAAIGSPCYTSGTRSLEPVEALRIRAEDLKQLRQTQPVISGMILDRFAAAVSSRWHNADEQVKSMLERGMHDSETQTPG
jgi:CRP-like cAMP-binding protein